MRIAQLHLRAYGPFEGVVLDFDRPPAGLQIVYGPNEAGKSTAMRAIAALLFGFPTQTHDGHHRDYAALRVGGVLDDGHGVRLAVMRRKGLRNTLGEFDPDTGEDLVGRALDQSAIDALLGGVDAQRFASMHGLDAERLREGGRSIAQGGGDLGAALFEAASGLPRLRAVIGSLTREADAIFVPRGQKPLLNAALSDHEQLRQAERAAGLRPRDWVQRRDALAVAEEGVSRTEATLRAERERLARLERMSALIPQVHRLAALRSASAALGDAPMLPPDAAERVAAWIHAQAESVQALDAAARRLARDRAALAELKVSQPHRDAAAAIVQLAGRVEAHEAARASLPDRSAELRVAAQGLDRALDEAGLPRDPGAGTPADVALARLPTRARIDAMNAAVQDRRGLEHRRDDAAAALAEAARELDASRVAPDDDAAPVALESLAAALEAATAVGDLEARIAALQARLVTHEAGVARLAASLGGDDAESIARLVLPTASELDHIEAVLRQRDTARASLASNRAALVRDLERLRRERDELAAGPAVFGRDALDAARAARDRLLREALDAPTGPGLVASGVPRASKPAVQAAVGAADRIADARFDDATRLAGIESRSARIDEMRVALGGLDTEAERVEALARAARETWDGRLRVLGLPALDPSDYRTWAGGHARLLDAIARRDAEATEHRAACLDAARHLDALRAALGPETSMPVTLAAARGVARRRLDAADAAAERLRRRHEALARAERLHAQRRDALAAAQAALAVDDPVWTGVAHDLGLAGAPQAGPAADEVAARLRALDAVRDALALWVEAERRLRAVQVGLEQFRADALALAARLGEPPPAAGSESDFVLGCRRVLEAADRAHEARLALQVRIDEGTDAQASAVARRDDAIGGLAALQSLAGVADVVALQQAVARSTERRAQLAEMASVEATLRAATGEAFDERVAEATRADADALRAEIDTLRPALEAADTLRSTALAERERARVAFESVDGDAAAAGAASDARERLAAAGRLTLDWARLRLARELLEHAVQQHAQRVQGPMLASAARWFARLTGGRWTELRPDWVGDVQVLRVVGPDGVRLALEQLSEGAADALFLALRLAAFEVRLEAAPPVPLLLDDVLSSLDDARAALALAALAELGRRNQVVYFTHHAHLIDLARRAVPPGEWAVRDLVHRPAAG